ncbi:Protein sly1 [Durusdinium trenchii]|uniref:Protein sly1 n=1 Tax=Durusdinium trenchii TaxID=1381693 RepID=A0ABP0QAN9_9DINO
MAQSILELQKNAVLRMLNLGDAGDQALTTASTWKVLVYDKFCQEVVSLLLKVGGLRNHGVTLHLNINSERLPVADVPAVYFVEPTEQNISRIVEDLSKNLYESCYVNFASAVPRPLLEDLAKNAFETGGAQKVAGVFDRYISFVSLSPSLFSLNLPAAYMTLHSTQLEERVMRQYIERIVDGLLSIVATMRVLPVIRCPPGDAAEMIAVRLEERIRELLNRSGGVASELFAAGGRAGAEVPGAASRPLLIILDRDIDLVTMLSHTWTYQAMVHDVLGMRLNKMQVPVESDDASAPPKARSYDVDDQDSFWTAHAGDQFPEVLNAVPKAIEEFEKKRAEMSSSGEDGSQALAPGLAAAINALPEMTEKKRSIDMHTNIAHALVAEVKARELDRYYELEDQLPSQSLGTSISQLEQLLNGSQKGTLADKLRAIIVLVLTKPSISQQQLQGLVEAFESTGGDASAVRYLQYLKTIRTMAMPSTTSTVTTVGTSGTLAGAFGGLADRFMATGDALLAAGMSGIKNIVASKKELAICQIVEALMEQKQGGVTENYLYFDPKAPATARGADVPRIRAPFRRAMTFVVGGGNYVEHQSLQDWAQNSGRQVTYGSTDMVSPVQFVDELSHLGQTLGQGQSGGMPDLS